MCPDTPDMSTSLLICASLEFATDFLSPLSLMLGGSFCRFVGSLGDVGGSGGPSGTSLMLGSSC